jgi:hypothetical protein
MIKVNFITKPILKSSDNRKRRMFLLQNTRRFRFKKEVSSLFTLPEQSTVNSFLRKTQLEECLNTLTALSIDFVGKMISDSKFTFAA